MSHTYQHAPIGELVKRLVEARLGAFWTALLARVEEIDLQKCRAKVKPLVKLPVAPDKWEELPVLLDIPVDIARAGPFYVRRPYKQGDIVILVVLSHSLERVLHDHEPHEPGSIHINNLNDCVVLGGFRADTDGEYPQTWREDLLIQNAETGSAVLLRADGGMEVFLEGDPREPILLNVMTKKDYRLRSSEGQARIEAAEKIRLGDNPEFRVVLGEKLLEWLNSHVHTDVVKGDALSGPPAKPADDSLLSKLVYVQEKPPGQLAFPRLDKPGQPMPMGLPSIGSVGAWLNELGVSVPPGSIAEAFWRVVSSVGQALSDTVGEFVETVGKYVYQLGEEAVQMVVDAAKEVLQENWLQFLGLAFTNPAGALALFAEKLTGELLERLGGTDLIEALGRWVRERVTDLALKAVAEAIGTDNLQDFVGGVQKILDRCLEDGELTWDDAVREAIRWAQEQYGEKGIQGVIGLVVQFVAQLGGK